MITCYDGGLAMANGFTSQTIASGTSVAKMIALLAKQLPRISGAPIVGSFPVTNKRGTVLFGNTWNILLELSGGLATIDPTDRSRRSTTTRRSRPRSQ